MGGVCELSPERGHYLELVTCALFGIESTLAKVKRAKAAVFYVGRRESSLSGERSPQRGRSAAGARRHGVNG